MKASRLSAAQKAFILKQGSASMTVADIWDRDGSGKRWVTTFVDGPGSVNYHPRGAARATVNVVIEAWQSMLPVDPESDRGGSRTIEHHGSAAGGHIDFRAC
jgi:hypothetical protein